MNKKPTPVKRPVVKPTPKPAPVEKPVVVVKPIVSPPTPPAPRTDLQDIQAIADATFAAAKMPKNYSVYDLPDYLAYLVSKKSGQNPVLPVPVAVPTDVKNYNEQLSGLTLLLMATMRAAGMPAVQGNSTARNYTMKDLPSWVAALQV